MNGYVYQSFEPGLWTAGFYKPDGTFEPESDHGSSKEAAAQVRYLNGGVRGGSSIARHELQSIVVGLFSRATLLRRNASGRNLAGQHNTQIRKDIRAAARQCDALAGRLSKLTPGALIEVTEATS